MERAHLYLHLASIGDAAACSVVRSELSPLLKELSERDEIAGYRLVVVADLETAEDELLDRMVDLSTTGGRFPLIFALLQPHEPATLDLEALMQARAFQRFA